LSNLVSSPLATGNSTGSSLAAIFNVLKTNGNIDLSDLMNVINIGRILTGANSLTNATQAYTDEFITGLMNGSGNLVNSSNVAAVLGGLQALNKIDQSVFTGPSAKAYANGTRAVPTTDEGVAATMGALNSLLGVLK
jgi:hypothetical protein